MTFSCLLNHRILVNKYLDISVWPVQYRMGQAKERISALEFQVANYKNSLNTANEDVKAQEQRVKQLEEENESLRVAVEDMMEGTLSKTCWKSKPRT